MRNNISRREFFKLSGLGLGSLLVNRSLSDWFPEGEGWSTKPIGIGRITVHDVDVFAIPDIKSDPIDIKFRDHLVPIFEEILPPNAIPATPRWYRIDRGYMFSAYIQRVDNRHLNKPVPWVPESGWLAEVTVPYTRAYRFTATFGWVPLYRLYYQSVHWVTGVEEGPDKHAWYKITDELLHIDYHVPATHLRIINPKELEPISSHVPPEKKRIEVSLVDQTLTAYEDDKVVLFTLISSGIPSLGRTGNGVPTATPSGRFTIDLKMPSKHMGDGKLTDDIFAYELPGVPWVCFFHETGVAFHGTYWHHNFGRKMSHGCINMHTEEAKWLYRWTTPVASPYEWEKKGYGTRVIVT